ncbi:hypothetical protein, partial [Klebsiella pneumoniae]|uniref:hypothetical protein n=1 Tax=Klebsiella pneumoniae TaxID=573 RepID=UPI003D22A08A
DITQKINRERNLPGINIEVVALPNVAVLPNIVRTGTFPVVPPFRRVAAAPYPARGSYGLSLIYPLARLKLPVLAASKSLRRSRKAGAARMDPVMSLWDALRMNMMISYQELVRTFPNSSLVSGRS